MEERNGKKITYDNLFYISISYLILIFVIKINMIIHGKGL